MTMKTISGRMIAALLMIFGMIAARKAFAISFGGALGNSSFVSGCFQQSGLRVQNNVFSCNAAQWRVPLDANEGPRSIQVSGTNASGTLSCSICQTDQSGTGSCAFVASFASSGTSVRSGSITVPHNGSLFLECFLGFQDSINTINYNQ